MTNAKQALSKKTSNKKPATTKQDTVRGLLMSMKGKSKTPYQTTYLWISL